MPPIGLFLFIGIAALIAMVVRNAIHASRERRLLREQHPDEPWMWRRDWSERAVHDTQSVRTGVFWAFALLWTAISLPVVFLVQYPAAKEPQLYLVLAFPILGAIMIAFALYQTLRRHKYGLSICRIDRLPIPVGSTLRGEVQARVRETPESGFVVRLTSLRRIVTRSGKSTTVSENILWQEQQTVGSGHAMPSMEGMRIPFHFVIPATCEPANIRDPNDAVIWRLEVSAEVTGIDYSTRFELPVFQKSDAQPRHVAKITSTEWTPGRDIEIGLSPTGGEKIIVRARRRFSDWLGLTLFFTFWYAVLFLMTAMGAPFWIAIVFGLIGGVALFGALDFLLGRSTISADHTTLTARRSWLFLARTRRIDAREVEAVESRIGYTSGSHAYYDVVARLKGGATRLVAKNVRHKHDAEMLAARVARAVRR